MRKIISFMHISLDGFVAGPNGEMDWITVNQEIFEHVGNRIGRGNTSLYGRKTFEMMEGYWPTAADRANASKHDIEHSKWYSQVHKVVLSKSLKESDFANTTIISDNIVTKLSALKEDSAGGNEDILLFGSPGATHALIELNQIDGYWLFVNPVILGHGIQLFKGFNEKVPLELLGTKQFDCGVTELNYVVRK